MESRFFRDLFYNALQLHRNDFSVSTKAIEQAIIALQNEYSPKEWKSSLTCSPVNYNDAAFRCAYLYKYASCHAALVQEVLLNMMNLNISMLWDSFFDREPVNICCLGGGPGTDMIGLLAVLCSLNAFQNSTFKFTVVDCMKQWFHALESVIEAAHSPQFQFLSSVSSFSVFLQADMLGSISESVREAIKSADMVTMVKFVSAAASTATPNMIRRVFDLLKPGALVFFIDNAGGGYYEMVLEQAFGCGLSAQCEPFLHVRFKDNTFKQKMFGFFSLSSTTVTAQMWRKNFSLFWVPYGYRLPQRGHQPRLNGKRHRFRPFSSKFKSEHESDKNKAVSKEKYASNISMNSSEEHNPEIRDQMQKCSLDGSSSGVKNSCNTSTDPSAKRKISWTCNHSVSSASSSESNPGKLKLSPRPLWTSNEELRTSKRKVKADKGEIFSSSNSEPSTSKRNLIVEKSETLFSSDSEPNTTKRNLGADKGEPLSSSDSEPSTSKRNLKADKSESLFSSDSEPNTSRQNLKADKSEPLSSSGSEPNTSKRNLKADKSEPLFSSDSESSTSKHSPNKTVENSKGKNHSRRLPSPSCSDVQDLSTQNGCLRMQNDTSASTSLQDKASQVCSTDSSGEDTSLKGFQLSYEIEKQGELEPRLENSCSAFSQSEDGHLEATSSAKEESSPSCSVKPQVECHVNETHDEVTKLDDLESIKLQDILPIENFTKNEIYTHLETES